MAVIVSKLKNRFQDQVSITMFIVSSFFSHSIMYCDGNNDRMYLRTYVAICSFSSDASVPTVEQYDPELYVALGQNVTARCIPDDERAPVLWNFL